MSGVAREVFARLDAMGIAYRAVCHPPAFTMEDCADVDALLGALTVKNIFLTTKNHRRCCLCITRPEARFHTADVSKQAGFSRLSFAPEEMLMEKLRARPGSASPMGLLFDSARDVTLLVDERLRDVPVLAFHPCDNTQSLAMTGGDFFNRFLPNAGVEPVFVRVEEGSAAAWQTGISTLPR